LKQLIYVISLLFYFDSELHLQIVFPTGNGIVIGNERYNFPLSFCVPAEQKNQPNQRSVPCRADMQMPNT
ncbi:MAG: hypothetical protein J6W70_02530, partial [Lentisphaeria bacterium]|nr:hypothetical protein [Lentisphaeria bacterium]